MSINIRLKEERKRLGFSQEAFAKVGGVGKSTQVNYETGDSSPNSSYLSAIHAKGADIYFIVTGTRLESVVNGQLEMDVLTQIIEALDAWEKERVKPVASKVKAELTVHFYEYFYNQRDVDKKKIEDHLRLIA